MQNLENLDVFEILITQKLLKCPKDPFVRSALIYIYIYIYIYMWDLHIRRHFNDVIFFVLMRRQYGRHVNFNYLPPKIKFGAF